VLFRTFITFCRYSLFKIGSSLTIDSFSPASSPPWGLSLSLLGVASLPYLLYQLVLPSTLHSFKPHRAPRFPRHSFPGSFGPLLRLSASRCRRLTLSSGCFPVSHGLPTAPRPRAFVTTLPFPALGPFVFQHLPLSSYALTLRLNVPFPLTLPVPAPFFSLLLFVKAIPCYGPSPRYTPWPWFPAAFLPRCVSSPGSRTPIRAPPLSSFFPPLRSALPFLHPTTRDSLLPVTFPYLSPITPPTAACEPPSFIPLTPAFLRRCWFICTLRLDFCFALLSLLSLQVTNTVSPGHRNLIPALCFSHPLAPGSQS